MSTVSEQGALLIIVTWKLRLAEQLPSPIMPVSVLGGLVGGSSTTVKCLPPKDMQYLCLQFIGQDWLEWGWGEG